MASVTTVLRIPTRVGPDVTIALHDIMAGDELTWDYRESGSTAPD